MEKAYWLSRERAALKLAKNAVSSKARLVHYDMAGRYSLKVLSARTHAIDLADSLPRANHQGRTAAVVTGSDDA
jgi:hypothetical protein